MTDTPAALSPEATKSFTEAMFAAGRSQADVDAALAPIAYAPINPDGASYRTSQEADAAIEKSRADTEAKIKANIAAHTAPPNPDTGQSYEFRMDDRAGADLADLATLRTEFSRAFAAMSLPSNLAQPLVSAFLLSQDETDGLSEVQRAQYNTNQRSMLAKMTGGDQLMKLAAQAMARMPQQTRDALQSNGCLDSARTIAMLANAERAIAARELSQKK